VQLDALGAGGVVQAQHRAARMQRAARVVDVDADPPAADHHQLRRLARRHGRGQRTDDEAVVGLRRGADHRAQFALTRQPAAVAGARQEERVVLVRAVCIRE
jgi:hypothetical protein